MNPGDQHQMVVMNTYPTGAQEWFCPTCGRHYILQWPPNYKRIILEEGDNEAVHAGGTVECILGQEDIQLAKPESDILENHTGEDKPGAMIGLDDPYLLPWLRWIGDRDF
jgi:hypothetical protein